MTKAEKCKERYNRLKQHGICVGCGHEKAEEGKVYCNLCAAKRIAATHERYYWLKEHGVCVYCGHEKARKGKTTCAMCAATANESHLIEYERKRLSKEFKQQCAKTMSERYARLKEQGICVRCGKEKALEGRTKCEACTRKYNRYSMEYYHKNKPEKPDGRIKMFRRVAHGLCYFCGNPIEDKRFKLCNSCLEQNRNRDRSKSRASLDRLFKTI